MLPVSSRQDSVLPNCGFFLANSFNINKESNHTRHATCKPVLMLSGDPIKALIRSFSSG